MQYPPSHWSSLWVGIKGGTRNEEMGNEETRKWLHTNSIYYIAENFSLVQIFVEKPLDPSEEDLIFVPIAALTIPHVR